MKIFRLAILFLTGALLAAPAFAQSGFPFANETLKYTINWPSGLSLGDVSFTARKTGTGWSLETAVDASVPGYALSDKYRSAITPDLCSLELDRDVNRGGRKSHEKTTFDRQKGRAQRMTVFPEGGGTTNFDIPSCAKDALAFVYFARKEMGQGRMAPQQQVYLGAAYSVRLEYTGAMTIRSADKPAVTDHVNVSVKGPKTDITFEVFFARDAARTPLLVKVPVSVGTFSLELVR